MIRALMAEFARPGGSTTPHHRGGTLAWHAWAGVVPGAVLGWGGAPDWAACLLVALVYFAAKEIPDVTRGGSLRDGIEDTVAVTAGAWAGAFAPLILWPALVINLLAVYAMAASLKAQERELT